MWNASSLKKKHKEEKHQKEVALHLASINAAANATLTFLLTDPNLAWKVIGGVIDVLLF